MTPPSNVKPGKKRDLKEKIVQIYENLLRIQSINSCDLVNNEAYWNEFYLLRSNPKALVDLLTELNYDELVESGNLINLLFTQSAITLNCDNNIKITNSLVTLLTLSRTIFGSTKVKVENQLDILIGKNDLNLKVDLLTSKLYDFLVADNPVSFKSLVIKLYLTFLTGYDDINANPFAEHLMSDELFDAFISIFVSPIARQAYGYQALLIITILINHRKNKVINPFTVRLSILDNEVVHNGFAQVISHSFIEFIKKFYDKKEETTNTGLLSSITSMVGNMFAPEEESIDLIGLDPDDGILMAFYGIVHLNRNFISQLANISAENHGNKSGPSTNTIGNDNMTSDLNLPSNLLVIFFEFCSIVMLQTKDEENFDTSRLCFVILTCISEDQCANAIMHDLNIVHAVNLHRLPMRHRKVVDEGNKSSRPLAYSVMDLMVEFISTHLRKNFLCELYTLCIGVIHRLLCYQKKSKVRFNYTWRNLWNSLINLLKFLVNHEADLVKKCSILLLANQIVNIFNLFITFGDTFLPSLQSYDDLHYEIIRMHKVFDNLYSIALRYSSMDGSPCKDHATRLASSLINVKSIIGHFNGKIEAWSVTNQISSLTEDQVLDVVRNNYDSLTLILQDGLDQYENYSPDKIHEIAFFNQMIKKVIINSRSNQLDFTQQDQQTLMQDILTLNL
ncbi:armadillo-like helical domain-containing protein 3 [Panonychus citri]|uniref:armadillo-like helical domain-containing protein 3 n=1 Tax=Panonychus citri TaxID=50023 RepID=UPI00230717DB|nr:armadillo-like helical domain-containing protein 3 [Panonychus citri]